MKRLFIIVYILIAFTGLVLSQAQEQVDGINTDEFNTPLSTINIIATQLKCTSSLSKKSSKNHEIHFQEV